MELDAHHITPREDMPNGGYVAENGISVCEPCHLKAEAALQELECEELSSADLENFMPDKLYCLIKSSYEQAVLASEQL